MRIITYSLLCFFVGFVIHIVWWRVRKPINTTIAISLVFGFCIPLGWLAIVWLGGIDTSAGKFSAHSILMLVLALALAVAYISTYPALENDSPTLRLVFLIFQHRNEGISEEMLYKSFSNEDLLRISITEMFNEGLVYREGSTIVLTKRGRWLAGIFGRWRRILDAGIGG